MEFSEFAVQGLSHEEVFSFNEALLVLEKGIKNRHIGQTKQNISSSRSHAVFQLHYCVKYQ